MVCFTSDHDSSFAQLSPRRVRTVFEAWVDRTQVLSALPETRQVYCFENKGEEIGVTLHHPHGQIYAFPFVAPRLERMVAQARDYAFHHAGGNLFDDLVAAELQAGTQDRDPQRALDRVRARGGALAVRGADLPRRPGARPDRTSARRRGTRSGRSTWTCCAGSTRCSAMPAPYIAAWHQAPVGDEIARRQFAAHLQVLSVRRAAGKLKYLAGTESGMGVWINDIVPEEAAQRLREA